MLLTVRNRRKPRLNKRPADSHLMYFTWLRLYVLGSTPPAPNPKSQAQFLTSHPLAQAWALLTNPTTCPAPLKRYSAQVRSAFSLSSAPRAFPPLRLCSSCSLRQDAFLGPLPFKSHQQVALTISTFPTIHVSPCSHWSIPFLSSCCP